MGEVMKIFFVCASLIINVCALPAAMFIGVMATDAPGSGLKEFFIGFFFIQWLPLLLLVLSIYFLIKERKNKLTNT
ncbi:hypothetical protein [Bacillus cereus]|uniref:hypothetical protein n=2 Tax=Bacillus TaxID=1386 RepID=UPI00210020D3|nr:hypothetical protein [Bacillus cereus]